MSNKRKAETLVDSAAVVLTEKHIVSCRFQPFSDLAHLSCTSSPLLKCHGHEWQIRVWPGDRKGRDTTKYVSINLVHVTENENIRVNYEFRVGQLSKRAVQTLTNKIKSIQYEYFATRADVLDPSKGFIDDDGSLLVKIGIQMYTKKNSSFTWTPKKKLHRDMLQLLESGNNSDAIFSLGGTEFRAHSHILDLRAPTLPLMVEDTDGTEVAIENVEPSVFQTLLRFIYSEEIRPENVIKQNARKLIEVADRFGCTDMKLHVEAEVVNSILTADNAADWLVFADSHNCALLKETAISCYVSEPEAVMESTGWAQVRESSAIMEDLTRSLVGRMKHAPSGNEKENDVRQMTVSKLRERLDEKGLDVDGTREMLVDRLEKAGSNP